MSRRNAQARCGAGEWNRTTDLRFTNLDTPSSDKLSQETTKQDTDDMAPDGAELSCPGSSEVAEPNARKSK